MPLGHIAPNPALMRELEQVSADAVTVLEALASVNALPEDFPEQEIRELCLSLRDLKDGTDEGSRSQLESARNRIPKWRRMHFLLEDEEAAASDDVVRLYRDMHLDQRLGRLLISATTALDEFRAQVQEHFDDTVVAEATFSATGDAGAVAAIERRLPWKPASAPPSVKSPSASIPPMRESISSSGGSPTAPTLPAPLDLSSAPNPSCGVGTGASSAPLSRRRH